jgi:hypothetical protein
MYLQESLEGYRRATNTGVREVELRLGDDFFFLQNADCRKNWSRNGRTGCGVCSVRNDADRAGRTFCLVGMVMGRLGRDCP